MYVNVKEGGNMNDIKLVEFILNHQLQYQIGELVNITGETRKTLLRVIKSITYTIVLKMLTQE